MGMIIKVIIYAAVAFYALSWLLGANEKVQSANQSYNQAIEADQQAREDGQERYEYILASVVDLGIEDPKLQECISSWLQSSHNKIMLGLMNEATDLEILDCSRRKISNLAGLQNFTRLKTLYLASNAITDISPIHELHDLKQLNLSGNPIRYLGRLNGLSSLEELKLRGVTLHDVAGIADLPSLRKLDYRFGKNSTCSDLDLIFGDERSRYWGGTRPHSCQGNFGGSSTYSTNTETYSPYAHE